MSRSLDLLLLALVGGLAWWLFGAGARLGRGVEAAPPTPAPVTQAGSPSDAPPLLLAAVEKPPLTPPGASSWEVDDAALLTHPSFRLVVVDAASSRLAPLRWERAADGRVTASFAPEHRAVGLALVHPTLEVLAWLPVDPTTGAPEERPVRLAERFQRIALDVRDPDGSAVDDARLSLWSAEPPRTLDGTPSPLPVDADGKVLLPRRAGVRVGVRSAHGTATVDDPVDGRMVQLTGH